MATNGNAGVIRPGQHSDKYQFNPQGDISAIEHAAIMAVAGMVIPQGVYERMEQSNIDILDPETNEVIGTLNLARHFVKVVPAPSSNIIIPRG